MKKCTNCAKDLPDAAMHCVFCGSKQPAAPAPAAGAQAKTVMGWQASDLLKDMQSKGVAPPPAAGPPPPAAGPPPAAPPPAGPAPVHSPAAVAATLVPQTAGAQMGGMQQNPAQAATMFQQSPFAGQQPPQGQPMSQPPMQQPPPPAHNPAASAATMFVQGPSPASLGQTIPAPSSMGPPPPQQQPYQPPPMSQPPPYQQQPPPYQQQPPPYQQPPMGGGYQQPPPYGQPPPGMGGYNPMPVGQPMNPPYLASQTAARVGAPVEPYKDGIKLVLIAFGVALIAVFAAPMSTDPLTWRWDALSSDKLDGLAKFDQIYFAAAGLLALVFGAVPLATVPRGALAAVLGLVPIALGLVNHLRGPKVEWQVLVGVGAALTLVPGLLLRHEYRSQMLPRLLTTIGAACVLIVYFVPKGGGDPPIAMLFEAIGNAPGKTKVIAILALMPFTLAVLSLLVWLPPPTTAGSKIIAWLIIVTGVIIAYAALFLGDKLGDQIKLGFNAKLIQPWASAAWAAFIGYGLATIFGKSLEHS